MEQTSCTYSHEHTADGLLRTPVSGAGGEGGVEQLVMSHHLSHRAEQSLHLLPVDGRVGHLLQRLHVDLREEICTYNVAWFQAACRSVISNQMTIIVNL